MIKAKDDWNTVLGGPDSQLNNYSMNFLGSFIRTKRRKDKIKKIFNGDRKEK